MSTASRPPDYVCGVCLDFGYLPDVGPCPGCRLDEYAEYLLVWAREVEALEDRADEKPGTRFDAA